MNIGTACCHSASCSDTSCPGRPDPALTRSTQEAEYLWTRNLDQCARSGQMDSRQQYDHERAGELLIGDRHAGIVGYAAAELEDIGVEAADAARVTGAVPPIVTTELRPVREPWRVSDIALVVAVVWLCGSIVYLRFWG